MLYFNYLHMYLRFLLLCILGELFISGIATISVALVNETRLERIVRHQGNTSRIANSLPRSSDIPITNSMTIHREFLSLMITWTHRVQECRL